jgi:hypothetical protein
LAETNSFKVGQDDGERVMFIIKIYLYKLSNFFLKMIFSSIWQDENVFLKIHWLT